MNSLYQSLLTAFFILLTALCFYLNRILVDKRKLQRTNALLKRLYSSNLVYAQLERQIHTLKSVIEDYPWIPESEDGCDNNGNNNCFSNNARTKTAETVVIKSEEEPDSTRAVETKVERMNGQWDQTDSIITSMGGCTITSEKPTKNVNGMSSIDDGVGLATLREACEMLVTGEIILKHLEKQQQAARVDLLKDGVYTECSQQVI